MGIISQIWHKAKCYFIVQAWYLIIVPNMNQIITFFSDISQQTLKHCHNYSNLAQSQILFYMHQQPMIPDHGTQYEENPASHHGRMNKDRHPDGRRDGLTPFLYSPIPLRQSRE